LSYRPYKGFAPSLHYWTAIVSTSLFSLRTLTSITNPLSGFLTFLEYQEPCCLCRNCVSYWFCT